MSNRVQLSSWRTFIVFATLLLSSCKGMSLFIISATSSKLLTTFTCAWRKTASSAVPGNWNLKLHDIFPASSSSMAISCCHRPGRPNKGLWTHDRAMTFLWPFLISQFLPNASSNFQTKVYCSQISRETEGFRNKRCFFFELWHLASPCLEMPWAHPSQCL